MSHARVKDSRYWIIACAAAGLAAAPLAARPWPDSTARTVAFADQLPPGLTATQRWFAATKLAGTQKLPRSDVDAIRAYNTNFLCLHYQLAVGCGPADFIVGNAWTSDWNFVSGQTNWFLRNGEDQRVHQSQWDWDVMDIRYSNGVARTGFPQYWTTQCLARITAAADDGVFADSFTQDVCSFGQCDPTHPWLEDVDLCRENWIPALTAFGTAVRQVFDADGRDYLFIPNLGSLITSWDTTPYGLGHGGMIEGFALAGNGSYYDISDWQLQMNRALALGQSNKVIIAQTYTGTANYSDRLFALASYLLVRGSRTYLSLMTAGYMSLEYYPEYEIATGAPLAGLPNSIASCWDANWGVYRRDFSNGVAVVNPGDEPVTITNFATNYVRVVPTGGGAVGSGGSYSGKLSYRAVTSLTLAAHSAAVLLNTTNAPTSGGGIAQPSGLAVTHRSGQSFITWAERDDPDGERYRVYRHSAPINASNLARAAILRDLPEGTGNFYCNRFFSWRTSEWAARYLERYVITPGGPQIPDGTGLLAWTLAPEDFAGGTAGAAWYAVTTIGPDGVENTNDFTSANTFGPVSESVDDPLPVEAGVDIGQRGHVYIQYMDLRHWNPTFHAPHSRNYYYGLDPATPGVTNALQYAYDYVVYEPDGGDSSAPLFFNLHGWSGGYEPYSGDPEPFEVPAYKIYPSDVAETWYFGFAQNCDYRTGAVPQAGDHVENYTEQRLLRMLRDLVREPPVGIAVDTNRVYIWGHSMGGSGTMALALRYPQVFAAAYASEPMTDYRTCGDGGGINWRVNDIEWKWGESALNLPVVIRAPGGWAAPLQSYNGMGVWDWQSHRSNVLSRSGADIVPLGFAHGTFDDVIEWPTQGQPAYAPFDAANQPWAGAVTPAGHTWQGFWGMPPTLWPDRSLVPFKGFSVVRNESVPGLSGCSANAPLPPVDPGEYNEQLEWSASWNDWDGAPLDTVGSWRISLRTLNNEPLTVAVTPRRLQRLVLAPGMVLDWENRSVVDNSVVQSGTCTVGANGLATVPSVQVSPEGNRLQLTVNATADLDGDGMPDSWEALRFANGTAATVGGDADGDGVPNISEYVADTDPSDASSLLRLTALLHPTASSYRVLQWPGSAQRVYSVQHAPTLSAATVFTTMAGASNLPGSAVNTYTDTVHAASASGFYRIEARLPQP